jgi:flagellar basal-body rod protein FlgC
MSLFDIYNTAHNGLEATRGVMQLASENVSNMLTPGYKAKSAVLSAKADDMSFSTILASTEHDEGMSRLLKGNHHGMGSQVAKIVEDRTPGYKIFMPNHPLADSEGNVEMSNVDGSKEMLNMMNAVRQYKANLSIVEMAKKASQEALNMTKNS